MDKTGTICQEQQVNGLVLYLLGLKKCAKCQSNPIILSKFIVLTNNNNNESQTDTVVKQFFLAQGVQKCRDFIKI